MTDPKRLGPYQLSKILGRGNSGTTYLGVDDQSGASVVVRILSTVKLTTQEARASFTLGSWPPASIRHPHLAFVADVGITPEDNPFVVTHYADGYNLEYVFKKMKLEPRAVVHYLSQIAAALDHAHQHHILHRNLKPTAIVVNTEHEAVLLELGIAALSDASLTPVGTVMGSTCYLAPEQLQAQPIDYRADIFSLSLIAFEGLTGHHPFKGGNFAAIVSSIMTGAPRTFAELECTLGARVEAVLHQGMAKSREERFTTCFDFIQALSDAFALEVSKEGIPPKANDPSMTGAIATEEQEAYQGDALVSSPPPPPPVAPGNTTARETAPSVPPPPTPPVTPTAQEPLMASTPQVPTREPELMATPESDSIDPASQEDSFQHPLAQPAPRENPFLTPSNPSETPHLESQGHPDDAARLDYEDITQTEYAVSESPSMYSSAPGESDPEIDAALNRYTGPDDIEEDSTLFEVEEDPAPPAYDFTTAAPDSPFNAPLETDPYTDSSATNESESPLEDTPAPSLSSSLSSSAMMNEPQARPNPAPTEKRKAPSEAVTLAIGVGILACLGLMGAIGYVLLAPKSPPPRPILATPATQTKPTAGITTQPTVSKSAQEQIGTLDGNIFILNANLGEIQEDDLVSLQPMALAALVMDERTPLEVLRPAIVELSGRDEVEVAHVLIARLKVSTPVEALTDIISELATPKFMQYRDVLDALISLLQHEAPLVRGYAAKSLESIPDSAITTALKAQLELEQNSDIKQVITRALSKQTHSDQ